MTTTLYILLGWLAGVTTFAGVQLARIAQALEDGHGKQ